MMRSLIAIAALVASVSAIAGELDGKALLCKDSADDIRPIGWEFKDGEAIGTEIVTRGTEAVFNDFGRGNSDKTYRVSPTKVYWWDIRELNRATLLLQVKIGGQVMFESQCEVSPSLDNFRASMEAARADLQSELDERMKDNKI